MKKTTYFFLSCALLAGSLLTGCSSDEPLRAPVPAPEGVAASRSVADAEAIALALAEGRQGESRFGEQVFVDGVVALTTPGSRSGLADTLIYAVNYADNKGFALIAAPVSAEPIIGFTEQGSFDEETAAENPAFSFYLDAAKSYAASKISIGGGGITIDPSRPIETTEIIRPRVEVEWGQSFPEGMFCPNGLSGCAQTALAQMMTYLQKPTVMTYTYSGRDINSENLNWAALTRHERSVNVTSFTNNSSINSHLGGCDATEANHKTIARICRQLGELNSAKYDDGSSAKIDAVEGTLRQLLPQNTISQQIAFVPSVYNSVYDYLASHQSVAYVRGEEEHTLKAHAWVCDGGECIKVTQKLALAGGGYETIELSRKTYFHFNWGWCGAHNGYFLAGIFDPEDTSRSNSVGNFNYRVYLIHVVK